MAKMQTRDVLRQIDRLFGAGTVAGLSDAQLLGRFLARSDEAAFVALVARHGPMVLSVCRGVLRDPDDAEDAFQATFLILIRRAGSLRAGESLGGWLHRVAHRVALRAAAEAARRRSRDRKAGVLASREASPEESSDELRSALHAEIGRLPDRLRLPVVLCDLEGLTRDQAARRLRWTEGAVRGRLARARALLRDRLARRGVELPAAAVAAALARESSAVAVSIAGPLLADTARAASCRAAGVSAAGLAGRVIRSMALARLKAAAALLMTTVALAGTSAGLRAVSARQGPARGEPAAPKVMLAGDARKSAATPAARDDAADGDRAASKPASRPGGAPDALQGARIKEFEYQGRVVDPAGRPVVGAKVYLLFAPQPHVPRATTGPEGRFRFTITGPEQFQQARVAAEADGFAPGAASRGFLLGLYPNTDPPDAGRELTIALSEDRPIEGRVVDLEGRPVAEATVRVRFLYAPPEGDLTPWIEAVKAGEAPADDLKFRYLKRVLLHERRPDTSVTTDAQGRFTLRGLGRERLADIAIEAPTIRPLEVQVLTRACEPFRVLGHPQFPQFGSITYYGASPRLAAAPSRPIEGIVRDRETGTPIAGAVIESTKMADRDVWNDTTVGTTSDARGHYRLLGMPRGAGNVIVAGPPPGQTYLPAQIEVEDPPGLGPITLDIALPRGVPIEGRVADLRTGAPVAARVVYHAAADNPNLDSAPGFRANTDNGRLLGVDAGRDGRFTIAGLRGRGALVVWSRDRSYPNDSNEFRARFDFVPSIQGVHQAVVMIDIPAEAKSYDREILLDSGRAVEGIVLDPEGNPLDGARVYGLGNLGSWDPVMGSTFRVVGLQAAKDDRGGKPGPARSLVFLHEPRKLAGWVDLRGDDPGPLRIKLERWSAAGGRLVDPEGKPRPNITLRINARRPRLGGGEIWHEPERVRTDADGRFRIEGLAPGLPYQLDVQAPPKMRADRRIDVPPTTPGEERDLGTITIEFRENRG